MVAVVVAVTAGLGAASPARDALIRPDVGIGQVHLGMRLEAVRHVLGKPTAVTKRRRLGFGSQCVEYSWGAAPARRVGVLGRAGDQRVELVGTRLGRQKTSSGVGVGSTFAAARRRLGATCRKNTKPGALLFNAFCFTGRAGTTQTIFSFYGTCNLPPRTAIVCPTNRRTYTLYEVAVGTADGLKLSNGS